MPLEYTTYEEAKRNFKWGERWEVFDGNKKNFNISHEWIDRQPPQKTAIRIKFDNGRKEVYSFEEISYLTSQFSNFLKRLGINPGDRIVIMLDPSLEFYLSMFGTLKRGAIAVPCSTLFGPEAIQFRVRNSEAKMFVTTRSKVGLVDSSLVSHLIIAEELREELEGEEGYYKPHTSANDLAVIQFSSGTTGSPKPVRYRHEALTVSAVVAKFGIGLRDDDRYFCPSSPAWGHGIWYGTMAPLIFGNAIGAYSGKFDPEILLKALEEFEITNISAAPTVFRRIMNSGKVDKYRLKLRKISYTGEAMDMDVFRFLEEKLGVTPYGFYGSTEVGPIALHYGGFEDWKVKPGSLGKPMIGVKVAILDEKGNALPQGEVGHIAVWRKDEWVRVGDAGYVDEEGHFWYKARADDVIISAGYTIGPLEIEEVLMKHPAVLEAAVVGSPDKERGEIVKAFIKTQLEPTEKLKEELQEYAKNGVSEHE